MISYDEVTRTVRVKEPSDFYEMAGSVCSLPVLLVDTVGKVHTYEQRIEFLCNDNAYLCDETSANEQLQDSTIENLIL